jgi:alpha-L-fucosidase 2
MTRRLLFVALLLAPLQPGRQATSPGSRLTLWYRQPAAQWVEALPVGNGRLAAMVFGGIRDERLQLNEDTLWSGGPYDPANPDAFAALPEVRDLIFKRQFSAAQALVGEKMMARPLREMPFQPLGDLTLAIQAGADASQYRRDLDLDTAIARVSYVVEGVTYTREVFSSPVDQVIVVRLSADRPEHVGVTVGMTTPQDGAATLEEGATVVLKGRNREAQGIPGALTFQARARVIAEGGRTQAADAAVTVTGANAVTVLVAAATSYRSYKDVSGNPEAIATSQIGAASAKSFAALRAAHVAEHQRLFRRVQLDLGTTDAASLPTDERIQRFADGNDPQLAELYFQFGRYLLISSSRPGTQPATLQGDWNDLVKPPWDSKYTININTEMNYWPAEVTNLPELVEPLTQMVLDLTETGARTARVQYGARGWVAHHNTDLWRATAPVDGPQYGMWPTGGAWLCQTLWEHYLFTRDRAYLARIYPALKGASEFFLDTLVEEPTHKWLVTAPSLSPENRHPFGASIVAGPSMDTQILRDLFADTIQASEVLAVDEPLRASIAGARLRLPPDQIGKAGQLQEWLDDWDMEAPEIHHRHVSHLYALYPSHQISLRGTPALAAAARKSLETRGDEATGWGLGWRLNLWTRLQDPERAYGIVRRLIHPDRTYPNMFDAHPPFQIDGNFGGAAGIAEMLLQSLDGEIELLPALPVAWPAGHVAGLRARGGFEVEIAWRDGRLTSAAILNPLDRQSIRVRYGQTVRTATLDKGETFRW